MRIKLHKTLLRGLVSVLFLMFFVTGTALTTLAAEYQAEAYISVNQTFTVQSYLKPSDTFYYEIKAADDFTPMPQDCINGVYHFSLKGNDKVDVGPIAYTRPGKYTYTVKQLVEEKKAGYTYDHECYTVTVSVKNTPDGGLSATVELPVNREGFKESRIQFDNSYYKDTPKDPNSPQTGDTSNITLWLALAVGSFICLLLTIMFGRKQRGESEEVPR